ncbi:MAG TPA: PQQ-dependent sugar dehydrogenase [Acidobacteriota bacterium]|jgi:glucose/arabinose dehydrogenase
MKHLQRNTAAFHFLPTVWHRLALASSLLSVMTTCGQPPAGRGAGEAEAAASGAIHFRIETVASGLEVPWAIVFTADRRILFTERPGRVRLIEDNKLRAQPLATIPDVEHSGEIGLMGLALHPQFTTNHFLYLSYGYRANGTRVRVVRFRETNGVLNERRLIIENIPAASLHAGCRLRFGPDAKLYVTTGDGAERELAQRLDSLAGKTLRLNDDGTVPLDNPFTNQAGARPEIWSWGHRNSQGLDWQPGSNLMFQTEHGPSGFDGPGGGDEVNIVERGRNYGWPVIHHRETRAGMESPLLEFTPAVAPSGATFYRGSSFPQFRGNFFFGCLRGQCIIRVMLDTRRVLTQERLMEGKYGRIRDVAEGYDGAIYFCTSNRDGRGRPAFDDDRILRMSPVK